ncbi:hypothetical protein C8F01DRAFT_1138675 [Mycena amicta]|nr:hypothetical protein C8F01DRAFT_1138675 [Mycena amicta]
MPTAVAQIRRGSIRERAGSPSPGHVSSGGLCTAGAASEAAEEGRVDKQTTPSRAPERNQAEDEGPAHEDKKQLPSLNAGCGTAPVRGAFGTLAEHSGTKAGHWEWGNNDAASAIDSPQAWLGRREGKNRALPFLTTACTVARSDTTLLGADPKDTIPPRVLRRRLRARIWVIRPDRHDGRDQGQGEGPITGKRVPFGHGGRQHLPWSRMGHKSTQQMKEAASALQHAQWKQERRSQTWCFGGGRDEREEYEYDERCAGHAYSYRIQVLLQSRRLKGLRGCVSALVSSH